MGTRTPGPVVLDAGGLIALERGDRRVLALLAETSRVVVPAGVVAQTWRGSARQARAARILNAPETEVEALDDNTARAVGVFCGATDTGDVVDASVALAGRRHGAVVLTSDPADLVRLDPTLDLHRC
ncbi:hypothetical protein BH23ACT2_BH23ACT2_06640 [soil metagenome]